MIVGICDGEKEAREKLHKICENFSLRVMSMGRWWSLRAEKMH